MVAAAAAVFPLNSRLFVRFFSSLRNVYEKEAERKEGLARERGNNNKRQMKERGHQLWHQTAEATKPPAALWVDYGGRRAQFAAIVECPQPPS